MSQFTYACPVCHQHLKCDSSQAGSIMKCPTCYQRVIAPQAPNNTDSKLILTGQKYVEKNLPTPPPSAAPKGAAATGKSGAPIGLILGVVGVLVALGLAFLGYRFMGGSSGWQTVDIGDVGAPGSYTQSKDAFTVKGSGDDIFFQKDSFYYVYQKKNGDCTLIARVLSMQDTAEWAKAAVMIRDGSDVNARFASASVRPDGQVQFIWRTGPNMDAGCTDQNAMAGGKGFPKSIKITRVGNSFSAFYRLKSQEPWKQISATQVIDMAPEAQVGLAVCARKLGTLNEVRFDYVALTSDGAAAASAATPIVDGMVMPNAKQGDYIWRYTTAAPAADWMQPTFNAASWSQGPGGFGTASTPNTIVKTEWNSSDIWLRREFVLAKVPKQPMQLEIFHDDSAEVYINGVLAARLSGYTQGYVKTDISEKALAALRSGRNSIAVHCHQDSGGQNIDVGLTQ